MNIKAFTLTTPDSDGEMSSEAEILVDNPTKFEVRRIEFTAVAIDADGFAIATDSNTRADCVLKPSGKTSITSTSVISQHRVGTKRNNVQLRVNATLFAREHHQLGELELPAKDHGVVKLTKSVTSELIDGDLKLSLFRYPPDSDGEIKVFIHMDVQSRAEVVLPDVELGFRILSAKGVALEDRQANQTIRARGRATMWSKCFLEASKLKNAKATFDLSVFYPVHVMNCEGTSTPCVR